MFAFGEYFGSLFELLLLSLVGMGCLSFLNGLFELEFFHGFWYLLDPWSSKPNKYPKYGPRFFYCLTLAAGAGWAYLKGNSSLVGAALTIWLLVLGPKLVNAVFIVRRMCRAAYQRFIVGETVNPLLMQFAATARTSAADPFGPVLDLVKTHSWGIPTGAAMRLILAQGKIVEACAGTGYWAWMIWQSGGDIVAYDHSPGLRLRNNHHRLKPSWFPVRKGDGAQAAKRHSDRALLLCWPTDNSLSADALEAYGGDTVIFVGANDGHLCVTGSQDFHRKLKADWRLVAEEGIPCWGELKDSVRVYKRAPAADVQLATA